MTIEGVSPRNVDSRELNAWLYIFQASFGCLDVRGDLVSSQFPLCLACSKGILILNRSFSSSLLAVLGSFTLLLFLRHSTSPLSFFPSSYSPRCPFLSFSFHFFSFFVFSFFSSQLPTSPPLLSSHLHFSSSPCCAYAYHDDEKQSIPSMPKLLSGLQAWDCSGFGVVVGFHLPRARPSLNLGFWWIGFSFRGEGVKGEEVSE